jgi:transposase-like protein
MKKSIIKLPKRYKGRGRDFMKMMIEAIRYAEATAHLAKDKREKRNNNRPAQGTSYTNHGGNAATPTQG